VARHHLYDIDPGGYLCAALCVTSTPASSSLRAALDALPPALVAGLDVTDTDLSNRFQFRPRFRVKFRPPEGADLRRCSTQGSALSADGGATSLVTRLEETACTSASLPPSTAIQWPVVADRHIGASPILSTRTVTAPITRCSTQTRRCSTQGSAFG
jgi:hypothetical protein